MREKAIYTTLNYMKPQELTVKDEPGAHQTNILTALLFCPKYLDFDAEMRARKESE